jgi:hypothetical protein
MAAGFARKAGRDERKLMGVAGGCLSLARAAGELGESGF